MQITKKDLKRTLVVYTHLPHYRVPVFRALRACTSRQFDFAISKTEYDKTIKSGSNEFEHIGLPNLQLGPLFVQFGLFRTIWKKNYDTIVFLGNPYIISTWFYSLLARSRGLKVLYWTHGWLDGENGLRNTLRNLFYRTSDGLLLYGNRAKEIGTRFGFSPDFMHVVYNSLDFDQQSQLAIQPMKPDHNHDLPERFFLSVGRLIPSLQLELAYQALARIKTETGLNIPMVVVGNGPELAAHKNLVKRLGIHVIFLGAIYDETQLASLFQRAAATVAPGKVGLTAMHSLVYGAPVITHDNLNLQMPEVEAIIAGFNGDFFTHNSDVSLSQVMISYWEKPTRNCRAKSDIRQALGANYTPKRQTEEIVAALQEVEYTS